MHVFFGSSNSPRLNPEALGLTAEDTALASVIADETENERVRRRTADANPRSMGLLGDIDYYDTIPWDELLQSLDVLGRCTSRTGLAGSQLLRFAADKCEPAQSSALHWMSAYLDVLQALQPDPAGYEAAAKKAVEAISVAKQKERSAHAGKRSGEVRRQRAKIPASELLVDAKEQLITAGTSPRDVAAKLAARYNVSPTAIRSALRKAETRN